MLNLLSKVIILFHYKLFSKLIRVETVIHIYSTHFLYNLVNFIDIDIHLLQIQIYCCKINHNIKITLQRHKLIFLIQNT